MSARDEIFKKINAAVKRNKELSKNLSREKTIAQWVSKFFLDVESTKNIDQDGAFISLHLMELKSSLMHLDKKVSVSFKEPRDGEPTVEILWSPVYVAEHDCESAMALDASTAHFQAAMEEIK